MPSDQPRPTIALCMIVRDAACYLPALFETIEGCFDEVHITDTGSKDNTVALCEEFGAQLHYFEWIDDFAAARNASFSYATSDYIMWLDADDRLVDAEAFINWRDTRMAQGDVWMVGYHMVQEGDQPIISRFRERVFKRDLRVKWTGFVHEVCLPESAPGQKIPAMQVDEWWVLHPYLRAEDDPDPERNLRLLLAREDELDLNQMVYLGIELSAHGYREKSLVVFGKVLQHPHLGPEVEIEVLQQMIMTLLRSEEELGSEALDYALVLTQRAIQKSRPRSDFYSFMGDAYRRQGKIQMAIPFYEAARNCPSPAKATQKWGDQLRDFYPAYASSQLAYLYAKCGELALAEKLARAALEQGYEGAEYLLEQINEAKQGSKKQVD